MREDEVRIVANARCCGSVYTPGVEKSALDNSNASDGEFWKFVFTYSIGLSCSFALVSFN